MIKIITTFISIMAIEIIQLMIKMLSYSLYISYSLSLVLFLSLCLFVSLSLSLSLTPYIYLSISLSVCLPVTPSVCLCVYVIVCLCVCLSVYQTVCLSVCLSLRVCVCISLSLSLPLSLSHLPLSASVGSSSALSNSGDIPAPVLYQTSSTFAAMRRTKLLFDTICDSFVLCVSCVLLCVLCGV